MNPPLENGLENMPCEILSHLYLFFCSLSCLMNKSIIVSVFSRESLCHRHMRIQLISTVSGHRIMGVRVGQGQAKNGRAI